MRDISEALREASWPQRSGVYRKGAQDSPIMAEDCALILAQAGDAEAALDEIERLVAGASRLTVHTQRLNPGWDPIREDPRFKALLVKYAKSGEILKMSDALEHRCRA